MNIFRIKIPQQISPKHTKAILKRKYSANKLILNNLITKSDEVKLTSKPLVALESTIITHGLPYPTNLEMALEVEDVVRTEGAVPATIALLNGKFKIGLDKTEIEKIAKDHQKAIKISRRDLPYIFSKDSSLIGGTTVSATCIAAHAAGIEIFCTGGIGGVHRDFAESMDVSADLQELARTPVTVVSSGVKSILDIGKTLEYLETMGVCVATFNHNGSKEFPSFFTTNSGFSAPYNCSNAYEAACLIESNKKIGFNSGLLIAVPIPCEYAADSESINTAINDALKEAAVLEITGKKVTPFLLEKINKKTKGESLKSNLALIKNNAKVSAQIALELHRLRSQKSFLINDSIKSNQVSVIGGINLDLSFKLIDESTLNIHGVTQPVIFNQVLGGVGRNMAEALKKMGVKNFLVSSVGSDLIGRFVYEELNRIGIETDRVKIIDNKKVSTGSYCAVFGMNGDLKLALGSMKAHDSIDPLFVQKHLDSIRNSELCVIDADIPNESIKIICDFCHQENIPVWFNPTDIRKCTKVFDSKCLDKLTFMSPNYKELLTIFNQTLNGDQAENKLLRMISHKYSFMLENNEEIIEENDLKEILKYMLKHVPFIFLTRGTEDLVVASSVKLFLDKTNQLPTRKELSDFRKKDWDPHMYLFPIVELKRDDVFVNVSGAGDSNSSGIIAGIFKNYNLACTIYNGLLCAKYALLTNTNVSEEISKIDLIKVQNLVEKYINQVKTVQLK